MVCPCPSSILQGYAQPGRECTGHSMRLAPGRQETNGKRRAQSMSVLQYGIRKEIRMMIKQELINNMEETLRAGEKEKARVGRQAPRASPSHLLSHLVSCSLALSLLSQPLCMRGINTTGRGATSKTARTKKSNDFPQVLKLEGLAMDAFCVRLPHVLIVHLLDSFDQKDCDLLREASIS